MIVLLTNWSQSVLDNLKKYKVDLTSNIGNVTFLLLSLLIKRKTQLYYIKRVHHLQIVEIFSSLFQHFDSYLRLNKMVDFIFLCRLGLYFNPLGYAMLLL